MKKAIQILLAGLLSLSALLPLPALAAEGDEEEPVIEVTDLSLLPPAETSTILETTRGTTSLVVRAIIAPPDATNRQITWSEDSNSSVIKIESPYQENEYTQAATITAVSPGFSTVTVSPNGKPGAAKKLYFEVSGTVLSESTASVYQGETKQLRVDKKFGNAREITDWYWSSENTAIVRVANDGTITGVSTGSATVTCKDVNNVYVSSCRVTVTRNPAATITRSLSNGMLKFSSLTSEFASRCRTLTGENLDFLTNLSVHPVSGTLYDRYVSEADTGFGVSSSQNYYYTNNGSPYLLENITFVPKGTAAANSVEIPYTGYSTGGKQFTGTLIINLGNQNTSNNVSYSSKDGEIIRFHASDFERYTQAVSSRALRYVSFTPPNARYGTLYYKYVDSDIYDSTVSSGTRYFPSAKPQIDDITFVPADNYDGTFSLSFTACDSTGATMNGSVRITVSNAAVSSSRRSGSAIGRSGTRIYYEVAPGERFYFRLSDFSEMCQEETGDRLDYIYFTSLPSSSWGEIYYNRTTRIRTNDDYYREGSYDRLIEDLNFLAEDREGSTSAAFRGYSVKGDPFRGTLEIEVTQGGSAQLDYSVRPGQTIYFSASDFNDLCREKLGTSLNYIRFTEMPSASRGTLNHNGSNRVTTSTSFYRAASSSNRSLDGVSFTAADSFSGSVTIPFYGYDNGGERFSGTVMITASTTSSASAIRSTASASTPYYFTTGYPVPMRQAEIYAAAAPVISTVKSVRLQLQDSSAGRFVLDFVTPGNYTAIDPSKDYAFADISRISFLPRAGYSGTAVVNYVVKNNQGRAYGNTLNIDVRPNTASAYFSDMEGRAWAVPAVDFFRTYGVINGTSFTTYDPAGHATRAAFVTLLNRLFSFPAGYGTYSFPDVSMDRYYSESLASARAAGIVPERPFDSLFDPDAPITREDAALFLYRSLQYAGRAGIGSAADLGRFADGYMVSSYAAEAMGGLVRMGVFEGDSASRLTPQATLTRAQMAAILYRAVT